MKPSGKNRPYLKPEFRRYFWDVNFDELSVGKYPRFIAERILNYGDAESIQWLLTWADIDFIKELINTSRNLNARTRNFWKIILKKKQLR